LEDDSSSNTIILEGLDNSTIFLRSSVNYFAFNIIKADGSQPVSGKDLFFLKDMLGGTNISDCISGCVITVSIDWTCDLDKSDCTPKTSFQLTPPIGFNYRTVIYSSGQQERELLKLYGIRFLVQIIGQGGRFSFFRMVITIGAGAALFALATVIVDILLLLLYKTLYTNKKYAHFDLKPGGEGTGAGGEEMEG